MENPRNNPELKTLPNPKKYKDQKRWMQDCLHQTVNVEEKDKDQGIAQCLNMWRERHKVSDILRAMATQLSEEDLKGKKFKIRATAEVVEATGEIKERAGRTSLRVIHSYSPTGEPYLDWVIMGQLEETNEPVTFPKEKPDVQQDPDLRGKIYRWHSDELTASGYYFDWKVSEFFTVEEMKGERPSKPKTKEIKFIHLNPKSPRRYNLYEDFKDYHPENEIEEVTKKASLSDILRAAALDLPENAPLGKEKKLQHLTGLKTLRGWITYDLSDREDREQYKKDKDELDSFLKTER